MVSKHIYARIPIDMKAVLREQLHLLLETERLRRAGIAPKHARKAMARARGIRFYKHVIRPEQQRLIEDLAYRKEFTLGL